MVNIDRDIDGFAYKASFSRQFLKENQSFTPVAIAENLFGNPWQLPTFDSSVNLPGMGKTSRKAMPIGVSLGGKNLELFVKPFPAEEIYLAERESKNAQVVISRGINTPPIMALLEVDGTVFLLSKLIYGAEPLSARSLDFHLNEPRVYSPHDFLEDFIGYIATMHNLGIAHGDLHLGNIGFEYSHLHSPGKIIFDLETATVLEDQVLRHKNNGMPINIDQQFKMEQFERETIVDLSRFTAHLRLEQFPLSDDELLSEIGQIYNSNRSVSYGSPSIEQLGQTLGPAYLKILAAITRSI